MAKVQGFIDIFDELTWEMFKMSGGNPLIAQEFVKERNRKREKNKSDKEI